MKEVFLNTFKPKKIPSLDGIRGLSCLFVILGHFSYLYTPWFEEFFGRRLGLSLAFSIGNQYTGVTFFFVLSGFLITNLLILERQQTMKVDFKVFFIKRLFRIFPAYYFYFACIGLYFSLAAPLEMSLQDILAAITYTSNYLSDKNPWHIGHFWSLALEEQFYLIWPIAFALSYKRFGFRFPLTMIILAPLLRVATYYLFVDLRPRISIMTHTRIDSLMFGCLLAYAYRADLFEKLNKGILKFKLHYLSAFHIFFFSRFLQMSFQGKYTMTVGYSLDCLGMCLLIIYAVSNKSLMSRFLNLPLMVHLGSLSYSLYLWHVPFAWKAYGNENLALRLILIYLCALGSYLLIEAPFMKWRQRVLS